MVIRIWFMSSIKIYSWISLLASISGTAWYDFLIYDFHTFYPTCPPTPPQLPTPNKLKSYSTALLNHFISIQIWARNHADSSCSSPERTVSCLDFKADYSDLNDLDLVRSFFLCRSRAENFEIHINDRVESGD